jgi:hypothetical protein
LRVRFIKVILYAFSTEDNLVNIKTVMNPAATWAIYGLASLYSHNIKRPALDKFVDDALPLVAVNLEQFA